MQSVILRLQFIMLIAHFPILFFQFNHFIIDLVHFHLFFLSQFIFTKIIIFLIIFRLMNFIQQFEFALHLI